MENEPSTSTEKRKRRYSSPHANEFHSHKLHDNGDPKAEEEINALAIKLVLAKKRAARAPERDSARVLFLKEKLISKAMVFFSVMGDNIQVRDDGILHEGHYAQVDDNLVDALLFCVDNYKSTDGEFAHYLRSKFKYKRLDAAGKAAKEDTDFGGGETGSWRSLEEKISQSSESSSVLGDITGAGFSRDDENVRDTVVDEGLEGYASEDAFTESEIGRQRDDLAEELFLVKTLSLIAKTMGKTGKKANETRKLYTKMFFSETLTSMVKTRGKGELKGFIRQEKNLFKAVELPFQDTYTLDACRTIIGLWKTGFIEGIPPVKKGYWKLPAKVFISYLEGLGKPASDALVSQQRKNYDDMLGPLMPKTPSIRKS